MHAHGTFVSVKLMMCRTIEVLIVNQTQPNSEPQSTNQQNLVVSAQQCLAAK